MLRRLMAASRYLTTRSIRLSSLPLGPALLGAIGCIFFFVMTLGPRPYYWPNTKSISYGNSPPIATRSGWMSIACLPFVFATSTKVNFVTMLTGISYGKVQVFHRWISFAMYVLALVHTFPFIVFHVWKGDMMLQWSTSVVYWTGVVAILAQTWLTFASLSPLRALSYEFFKISHVIAAIVFAVFFFIHCDFRLTSWDYFIASGAIYMSCYLYSFVRTAMRTGRATLSMATPGIVSVQVPSNTKWEPGQYCFVRFFGMGKHAFSSHPFTICSLDSRQSGESADLLFYIHARGGFTEQLARYIVARQSCTIRISLRGPFGGIDTSQFNRSSKLLIIAGGSGAGWTLPLIECFLRRHVSSKSTLRQEPQSIVDTENLSRAMSTCLVVLATRNDSLHKWYQATVNDLVSRFDTEATASLAIQLHYTGGVGLVEKLQPQTLLEYRTSELNGKSNFSTDAVSDARSSDKSARQLNMTLETGRPDLPRLIADQAKSATAGETMGVYACGPAELQNDIRNAVVREQMKILRGSPHEVFLHTEHFEWA